MTHRPVLADSGVLVCAVVLGAAIVALVTEMIRGGNEKGRKVGRFKHMSISVDVLEVIGATSLVHLRKGVGILPYFSRRAIAR